MLCAFAVMRCAFAGKPYAPLAHALTLCSSFSFPPWRCFLPLCVCAQEAEIRRKKEKKSKHKQAQ
eukprot:1554124-Rhodomonas_salina.1